MSLSFDSIPFSVDFGVSARVPDYFINLSSSSSSDSRKMNETSRVSIGNIGECSAEIVLLRMDSGVEVEGSSENELVTNYDWVDR